jgi:hypothetical protein
MADQDPTAELFDYMEKARGLIPHGETLFSIEGDNSLRVIMGGYIPPHRVSIAAGMMIVIVRTWLIEEVDGTPTPVQRDYELYKDGDSYALSLQDSNPFNPSDVNRADLRFVTETNYGTRPTPSVDSDENESDD